MTPPDDEELNPEDGAESLSDSGHDGLVGDPDEDPNSGHDEDSAQVAEQGGHPEDPSVDPSEDLWEPDVFSDDGDEAPARSPRRRIGTAPALLMAGGGVWAVAMALRCSPLNPPTQAPTAITASEEYEPSTTPSTAPAVPSPVATVEESIASDAPSGQPRSAPSGRDDLGDDGDAEALEDPEPADWANRISAPDLVRYTVRHGGSLKNVANLYKIFHHEILALNPGVTLDQELAPGTRVIVYRKPDGEPSESVGVASSGSLVGGVPMLDGPGRVLKMIPWKSWASAHTVGTLDRVLRQWAQDETNEQPVLVGNMSARGGGKLPPHSTHQSGRDVDLGYLQKLPRGEELNWREMTADNLDPAATWRLLHLLRATGRLEVVFIDSKIQKLLYTWARSEGGMSKASLRKWMEYPRTPPVRSAIIQHVAGHVDHLHARFACRPEESRCKSRRR